MFDFIYSPPCGRRTLERATEVLKAVKLLMEFSFAYFSFVSANVFYHLAGS